MRKYFVYILQSQTDRGYYIGHTQSLKQRLAEHNAGKTRSLRARRPFQLVHVEEFPSKRAAKAREKQLKRYKGGEAFRRLLQLAPTPQGP
jgi:putative endonuclease